MNPKLHIVGLCGSDAPTRAAVATILEEHGGFRRLSFLDALHAEIREAFELEPAAFATWSDVPIPELAFSRCADSKFFGVAARQLALGEPHVSLSTQACRPRSPAEILALWGRSYRHAADPAYWSRQVRARITYYIREYGGRHFVVDAVRFEDEAQALRDLGGIVWNVRSGAGDAIEWADVEIDGAAGARQLREQVLGRYWARDAGLASVRVELSA